MPTFSIYAMHILGHFYWLKCLSDNHFPFFIDDDRLSPHGSPPRKICKVNETFLPSFNWDFVIFILVLLTLFGPESGQSLNWFSFLAFVLGFYGIQWLGWWGIEPHQVVRCDVSYSRGWGVDSQRWPGLSGRTSKATVEGESEFFVEKYLNDDSQIQFERRMLTLKWSARHFIHTMPARDR